MLLSHKYRFIYLKTRKTAGTSVEVFFERFCVSDEDHVGRHESIERVSEAGIVGSRLGGARAGDRFFHHQTADSVRTIVGPEIFDSYYKFCVVRNPFDKVVSHFWWDMPRRRARLLAALPFWFTKKYFALYVKKKSGSFNDRHIYMRDGRSVIDDFIRYESLKNDIARICLHLGIAFDDRFLGTFKAGSRVRAEPFSLYYSPRTAELVAQEFKLELEMFDYRLI